MIEARHLTKRYGKTVAVDEASFTVQPGPVTGFLGPNGAGKSTTMRMILGLDAPSSGESGQRQAVRPARRILSGRSGRCSTPRPSSAAAAPPTTSSGWPTATTSTAAGWRECSTSSG